MWYWYFGWWYLPLNPPAKVIYVDFKRRKRLWTAPSSQ